MNEPEDIPERVDTLEKAQVWMRADLAQVRTEARRAVELVAFVDRDNDGLKAKFGAQTRMLQALRDTQIEQGKSLEKVRETQVEQGNDLRELRQTQIEHSHKLRALHTTQQALRETQVEHGNSLRELRETQVEQGNSLRELRETQVEQGKDLKQLTAKMDKLVKLVTNVVEAKAVTF
jgi:hypothetical protein